MTKNERLFPLYSKLQSIVSTARNKEKGKPYGNNLRVRKDFSLFLGVEFYSVKHHNTDIIRIFRDQNDNLQCLINNGGWYSVTTKKNLNKFLDYIGYYIYQEKGVWYLIDRINHVTFEYDNRPEIGSTAIDLLVQDIKEST